MNFMFAALLIVVTSLGELEGGPDKYIDVPDKYIVSFCVQYKNEQLIVNVFSVGHMEMLGRRRKLSMPSSCATESESINKRLKT